MIQQGVSRSISLILPMAPRCGDRVVSRGIRETRDFSASITLDQSAPTAGAAFLDAAYRGCRLSRRK